MIRWEYSICKILGIPIKVHISLLLFLPVIAYHFSFLTGRNFSGWVYGLLIAIGLFVSVTLHELGHSFVAIRNNFPVREILLLPIGGAARLERLPSKPRQELLMALAGPAVSFLLFVLLGTLSLIVYFLFGFPNIGKMIGILAWLNLILALFNLIPSFPMDGGRVFRAALTPKLGRLTATRIAVKIGKVIAVFFGLLGACPPFNPLLIAIAFFLYAMAGAEYRMVEYEEKQKELEQTKNLAREC